MTDVTLKAVLLGEDRTMSRTLKGAGAEAGKTGSKLRDLGGRAKGMASGIAGAVKGFLAAEAVQAVGDFALASVDAASTAEQSLGGVGAVFGKNAKQINTAAGSAAKDLGLSATAYRDLASTLGAGLKNKGIKDYASSTQNLIGVGADLAAQFGGTTQQAVEALGSALRGEMDPIERYGVSMNAAALSAEAVALGAAKPGKPLSDQAKAMAALSLITKQTSTAQGAFARESGTLAGKQQRAKAQYEDLQATIGKKLLPAMVKVTDAGMAVMDWLDATPEVGEGAAAVFDLLAGAVEVVGEILKVTLIPALSSSLGVVQALADGAAWLLDALGSVPGFEWAKEAAGKLRLTSAALSKVREGLDSVGRAKPSIDVETAKGQAQVATLKRQIASVKGKIVEAKAEGKGGPVLEALRKKLAALQSKLVKVTAGFKAQPGASQVRAIPTGVGGLKMSVYRQGGRPKRGELAFFHSDELWVPDEAGTVVSQSRTRQMLRDGGPGALPGSFAAGGGSTTIVNVAVTSNPAPPREFARFIETELYNLLMSKGRGGRLRFA